MAKFPRSAKLAIVRASGASFWRFYAITSSTITTTAQNLTVTATGRLAVTQILVNTDATGLAGGTNFTILSNNANGIANIFVETVANLGANKSFVLAPGVADTDVTTSKPVPSVTAMQTILETGKRIQYLNTAGAGTGAGIVNIAIKFERIDENADIL